MDNSQIIQQILNLDKVKNIVLDKNNITITIHWFDDINHTNIPIVIQYPALSEAEEGFVDLWRSHKLFWQAKKGAYTLEYPYFKNPTQNNPKEEIKDNKNEKII